MTEQFEFGEFLLERRERRLTRGESVVPLPPKSFDVLVYLLEHSGQLVEKQELLDAAWGQAIVTENSLASCVRQIRGALEDSADKPSYIQTVSGSGYRFIGDVEQIELITASRITEPGDRTKNAQEKTSQLGPLSKMLIGAGMLGAASVVVLQIVPGPPSLEVSEYTQLTRTEVMFPPSPSPNPLVADASRIYFNDFQSGRLSVRQVSRKGGEATLVTSPFEDPDMMMNPLGLTPDNSQLLLAVLRHLSEEPISLWQWPVIGGAPRRLGAGDIGTYSPDGEHILYTRNTEIFLANADFSESRKIATAPARVKWPRISPDGQQIRFTMETGFRYPDPVYALWEMKIDGADLRPLLPDSTFSEHCCGSWTEDGGYYVFQATLENRTQLWAIDERPGVFGGDRSDPVQITDGALDFIRPTISTDTKHIFAIGRRRRGEPVELDAEGERWVPLPGFEALSAEFLSFSSDDEWVAYVSYPEAELWRSRRDGTERLRLSDSSMRVWNPQWSPDSQTIVFVGQSPGDLGRIYLVSPDGGTPQPVSADHESMRYPTWSPDGHTLLFNSGRKEKIQILDLASGTISELQGSEQLRGPQWSPDGRYLAVYSFQNWHLQLFDLQTGQTEDLIEAPWFGHLWDAGGESLLFAKDFAGVGESWLYRVNIGDHSVEDVAPFTPIQVAWGIRGMWYGLTPEGVPLMLRDLGSADIYELAWNPER